MKKRTFGELMTLGKKRYILRALVLLLIAVSGIGALTCIAYQITLISIQINFLSNYVNFINSMLRMIWLALSIMSWALLVYNRNLFLEGKLDWVFGDNLPDEPMPKKFYCKNKNCNNEITKNRYNSLWTDEVCDDCRSQSD